jgi:Na+/phosphate symporter
VNVKREHTLTKISLAIDVAAFIVLLVYFIAVAPYSPIGLGGLLILSPPLFGIAGLITVLFGKRKNKTKLCTVLMAVNIILICWWPILHIGGTLLFGP